MPIQTSALATRSAEFSKLADDLALPTWLRIDSLEDNDADRVLEFMGSQLLRVDQARLAVLDSSTGLWCDLNPGHAKAQACVRDLIVRSRREAVDMIKYQAPLTEQVLFDDGILDEHGYDTWITQWRNFFTSELPCTALHVSKVGQQLVQRLLNINMMDTVMSESSENFDDRNQHPILPSPESGGALDLTKNPPLPMPTQQAAELRLRWHGWAIPVVNPNVAESTSEAVTAIKEQIATRYGDTLITRLARHLLGTGKHIDLIVAPNADWGKGTLIRLCEKALPGAVARLDAQKALTAQGRRFSQIEAVLASKLIVFVDEGGEEVGPKPVPSGTLKTLTDDGIQVERKGVDNETLRRIGTAVIVGHDWPILDASSQGMQQRFRWCYYNDGERMDERTRNLILQPEAIEYFRYTLIERACELWQKHVVLGNDLDDMTESFDTEAAQEMFVGQRSNPLVSVLKAEMELGDADNFVASSVIKDILKEVAGEEIKPDPMRQAIRSAFPSAQVKPKIKRIDGKPTRGWLGIAFKIAADEEE